MLLSGQLDINARCHSVSFVRKFRKIGEVIDKIHTIARLALLHAVRTGAVFHICQAGELTAVPVLKNEVHFD